MSGVEIRKGVKLHRKTTKHGSTPLTSGAVEKKANTSKKETKNTWASTPPQLSAGAYLSQPLSYYPSIQTQVNAWYSQMLNQYTSALFLTDNPSLSRPEPKAVERAMPVIGYRGWRVIRQNKKLRLQSVNAHFGTWAIGTTEAKCQHSLHSAPNYTCECGLYVLAELKAAPKWYGEHGIPANVVIGAVVGWGDVIQHGKEGWRAQFAQPVAFLKTDVFGDQPLLDAVAKQYGLPILERRGLELMAAEYGERLESNGV